jgi:acetoin utilization deacetylase AcuC-like enzyme
MRQGLQRIPVFYSEHMLATAGSFSPSASKPRHVLAAWQAAGLPITLRSFTPASAKDIRLAHDPVYVRGVLNGKHPNGFDNTSAEVARSLPYTTGAMIAAARAALESGCACAPVSGFHHAQYSSASGYCTFNGLVITGAKLLAEDAVKRVMILDCDMHYGDGTDGILERLGLARSITNATFGRWFYQPSQASAYLQRLREVVAGFDAFDLVLYQAGADVHVNDPLGGVLTTDQIIERDQIVFEGARASDTPIAWNLAGGYQEPLRKVLDIHDNTMRACAAAYLSRREAGGRPKNPISSQVSRPVVDGGPGTACDQPNAHMQRPRSTPMQDPKPETPPLTRAGRKVADATLAAAQFKPTTDGKGAIRQFEVHGMAVTEFVCTPDAMPGSSSPEKPAGGVRPENRTQVKEAKPETQPLTRAGRKVADATLAAAKFRPTSDGKKAIRQFEVHGMTVTECVDAEKAAGVGKDKK